MNFTSINSKIKILMNDYFYLNAKATKRRRGYIVYLKEAAKILCERENKNG